MIASLQQAFYGPLSGTTQVSQYQKKHSPAQPILIINYPLSASFIYYDPWHPPCLIYVLDRLFAQPLSKSSLAATTSYISSPSHCLFFATHAHTIAACFAVVPRLLLASLSI